MNVHLTVPTDINEIPLKTYLRYLKKSEDYPVDKLDSLLLTVFFDLTPFQVMNMKKSDVDILCEKLRIVLEQKPELTRTFESNGVEWGFEPNLNEISMALFVDLDLYQKDVQDLTKLMAVLYRPIKKRKKDLYKLERYNGAEYNSIYLAEMPLGIALSAKVFFWTLGNQLIETIPKSLNQGATKRVRNELQMLKNGGGEKAFTDFVAATLKISKGSYNYNFILAFFGSQLKAMRQKLEESKPHKQNLKTSLNDN